jgi:hypothetical protein
MMKTHSAYSENEPGEKPHKRTKRFDDKVYRLYHEEIMTKSGAEEVANHMRNRGYLVVRVVKEPHHNEWLVYYRRK